MITLIQHWTILKRLPNVPKPMNPRPPDMLVVDLETMTPELKEGSQNMRDAIFRYSENELPFRSRSCVDRAKPYFTT